MDSETEDLDTVLYEQAVALRQHSDYFAELNRTGDVCLEVQWFTKSSHSVCILNPKTLKGVSELNVPVAIEHYCYPLAESAEERV